MAKALRRAEARLARRRAAYNGGDSREWRYNPPSGGGAQTHHRPGSKNWNKK